MITNTIDKIKSISQISYNKFIEGLSFHQITCSCGHTGQCIKHAYYNRRLKASEGLISLRILRVKCNSCSKTHAIFPSCIIPYSQVILSDCISIIKSYLNQESFYPIMINNLMIDESNIAYIIRQFHHHWSERLISYDISIDSSIEIIATSCIRTFKRQFMQIKRVANIIFI